ncbi:hypothetical protein [Aquisphaera insulae]|uniref:hypothetical protein n=1 Tax=Aquisphaera insulae TaxID=2712864 RepID=UPI0013EA002D|nr:hypothetical protein [Aquisphaera insulae]
MTTDILVTSFGTRARSMSAGLAGIQDEKQLEALHGLAVTCADLKEFRARLRGEKP